MIGTAGRGGGLGTLGRFGVTGAGGGSGVDLLAPGAVVATWNGDTADTRPDFAIDLPQGYTGGGTHLNAAVDDDLVGEYSANGGSSWSPYLTVTLNAGHIAASPITATGVTPLTGGNRIFRWWLERNAGANVGPVYTTGTVTVAPQITSSAAVNLAENVALSHSLTADESVTWSRPGTGADTALFSLAGSTLSMTAKDYEIPVDVGANNTYVEVVRATSVATGATTDQTITVTVTDVSEFEAESEAIFAAFTTPANGTRKGHINTLVAALKTAGVWTKLDVLYLLAAADSQAALINWKNPGTFNGTVVNAPAFAADRGFTGAATKIGQTGFNPSTAGGNYSRDSAHLAVWSRTAAGVGSPAIGFSDTGFQSIIFTRNSAGDNTTYGRINDPVGAATTNLDGTGFYLVNRSASNAHQLYKDGASVATGIQASVALPNREVYFIGSNAAGTASPWTAGEQAAVSVGSSLSGTEAGNFYAAMLAYMQAVGAA